jgi:IclR family pca regulon transcriptional regulator
MTVSLGIGSRLPAFCTSLGRVLLAALPPSEQREAPKNSDRVAHTKSTTTDNDELMKIFESVNRQEYAIINEVLKIGLLSLATPVRDQNGAVVAAMNIGLQEPLVSEAEMLETMLPVLSQAASELSSHIIL